MAREIPFAASSNLSSVSYDDETQELSVSFHKSGVYVYSGVPPTVADGFSTAPSAGQYLNQFVKPLYPYTRG